MDNSLRIRRFPWIWCDPIIPLVSGRRALKGCDEVGNRNTGPRSTGCYHHHLTLMIWNCHSVRLSHSFRQAFSVSPAQLLDGRRSTPAFEASAGCDSSQQCSVLDSIHASSLLNVMPEWPVTHSGNRLRGTNMPVIVPFDLPSACHDSTLFPFSWCNLRLVTLYPCRRGLKHADIFQFSIRNLAGQGAT